MKFSHLTTKDFIDLLKQSDPTIKASELYKCTRNANISIQNFEEVVSILKSIKKYMKLGILDSVIDFLMQTQNEIPNSTKKIQQLQTDLNSNQNQPPKSDKETKVEQIKEKSYNENEILSKISELKESDDFESIYNFLDELSSQGNQKMISKSCEKGLWKKIALKKDKYDEEKNVLHVACERGNLNLVKSLARAGCTDDSSIFRYDNSPLIYASIGGNLELVKYLIYIGANSHWWYSLICASAKGHLEVVKHFISIGANKEAKDNDRNSPLKFSSWNGHLEVVKYLISVGADKEAKNNFGNTPLHLSSWIGHSEVVQYLVSVGAKKEVKNNEGYTPVMVATSDIKRFLK